MANILLVEDEYELADLIKDWLADEGHAIEVVHDGQRAVDMLRLSKIDLVILDLGLPVVNGMEVCKRFRTKNNTTPILMLTAKSTVDDKEAGFHAGADDYLTKPFHFKELILRTEALLRRTRKSEVEVLQYNDIVLNTVECTVKKSGKEIRLLPQEYKLLEFFIKHPQHVFSAETLFNRLWEPGTCHSLDTIRGHIRRLRKKLDTRGKPSIISTMRHLGYKLN